MITTHDIGNLFKAMSTMYGAQWKHGTDSMGVWREALKTSSSHDIGQAATACLDKYPAHPPTLGQFKALVFPKAFPNTYLPAPDIAQEMKWANRAMMHVLFKSRGVSKDTLRRMIELKNALVEDFHQMDQDNFSKEVAKQLTALAKA